ncbi:MAG: hypothetical protein QM757_08280 [Paludibaculum sp.]
MPNIRPRPSASIRPTPPMANWVDNASSSTVQPVLKFVSKE